MLQHEQTERFTRVYDQRHASQRTLLHVLQHAKRPSLAKRCFLSLNKGVDLCLRGDALGQNEG